MNLNDYILGGSVDQFLGGLVIDSDTEEIEEVEEIDDMPDTDHHESNEIIRKALVAYEPDPAISLKFLDIDPDEIVRGGHDSDDASLDDQDSDAVEDEIQGDLFGPSELFNDNENSKPVEGGNFGSWSYMISI